MLVQYHKNNHSNSVVHNYYISLTCMFHNFTACSSLLSNFDVGSSVISIDHCMLFMSEEVMVLSVIPS